MRIYLNKIILFVFATLMMVETAHAAIIPIARWTVPYLVAGCTGLFICVFLCYVSKPKEIPLSKVTYKNSSAFAATSRYLAGLFGIIGLAPPIVAAYSKLLFN